MVENSQIYPVTVFVEFHLLLTMSWYANMEASHLFTTMLCETSLLSGFLGFVMMSPLNHLCSLLLENFLWQTNVRPPCLHIACSAENETPQTQWLGIFGPYLRCKTSQNSCFIKWNSCSPKGSAVCQEEAPGSLFKSKALWDGKVRADLMVEACSFGAERQSWWIWALTPLTSGGGFWATIKDLKACVILMDAANWESAMYARLEVQGLVHYIIQS